MNTKTFGILLGFVVLGIAFTGGAAATDSADSAEVVTQDPGPEDCTDGCHMELAATPMGGCCCCPVDLAATPSGAESDANSEELAAAPMHGCCCCPVDLAVTPSGFESDASSEAVPVVPGN